MYQIFSTIHYYVPRALALVLIFMCGSMSAQNQKIDSLLAIYSSQEEKSFDVVFELARQNIVASKNSVALEYSYEALKLASHSGDSLQIVKANRINGAALRRLERFQEAGKAAVYALRIAKRHGYKDEIKYLLNTLALIHTNLADYDKALDYNFQSLVVREAEGDKSEISIANMNIGVVYFKLRNYEKALEYFTRSLRLKDEIKDRYDRDRVLINIGICNIHLKRFKDALSYIEQGFLECNTNCSSDIRIEGEFGRGVANFYLDKLDTSEVHFKRSLNISKASDNKRFQAENLVYLGRIEVKRANFLEAKQYLVQSESLANSLGYNQLAMDTYREFSKLYVASQDFKNASFYQNRYISLKDSLISEDLVKNIAKIQTNFEERENLNTIKLREEDLARQRNLNIAIGLIAVLAGLLVFVLYRSNSITRKVNSALSDAKGVIETQNHRLQNINRELDAKVKEKTADLQKANEDLDKANKALVRVNDELDNFIYKTSHDIRGPLASLKGICSVALMDVKDPLALDYLTKLDISSGRLNVILTRLLIVNQINHAIVGREHIDFNGIVDDVLLLEKKKGLPERLEIKRDINKDINFQSDKDLVRIVLENLIDNSIKFYNDSERIQPFVHIKIAVQNDTDVVISVIDNGIGIAEAKPDKIFQMFSRASERSGTGGIGLYLSKLATEKLGGQINLRSTAEGYTEFYVSFPLKMQAS